jgi:hypothetical protein
MLPKHAGLTPFVQVIVFSKLPSANPVRENPVCAAQCCGSGMFIADPGSEFFPSRILDKKDFRIPDPHPHKRMLSIVTQKIVSRLSEI